MVVSLVGLNTGAPNYCDPGNVEFERINGNSFMPLSSKAVYELLRASNVCKFATAEWAKVLLAFNLCTALFGTGVSWSSMN